MSLKAKLIKSFKRRHDEFLVATGVDDKGRIVQIKTRQESQVAHLAVDTYICAVKCAITTGSGVSE